MGASLLINPGELRLANDIAHNLKWVLLSLEKDRGGGGKGYVITIAWPTKPNIWPFTEKDLPPGF